MKKFDPDKMHVVSVIVQEKWQIYFEQAGMSAAF
jgi:hypothetical protein